MSRVILALSLAFLPSAFAGEGQIQVATYGTTSPVAHTLQAFAFDPIDLANDFTTTDGFTFGRRCYDGIDPITCTFAAPLMLPAGASILSVKLDACDGSSTYEVHARLQRVGANESSLETLADLGTGPLATPGCATVSYTLPEPHTVNNAQNSYVFSVRVEDDAAPGAFQMFHSVQVLYKLQVSAPPGTPTFSDVGTGHPFFQFVEALAAAGITAGCGQGNFCPDAPVTRGQMAVFLATALGLHWAP